MRQTGQHDAFAQPPLVEDLAFLPVAGHDDDHGQGRAGQVPNVSFQPGQGFKGRAIVDHDDFGGLLVAGAAGPAGDVEDVADHVLRHRRGFVLPNRAQALEKVRDLSGRVRLRHPRPRLRAMPDPLSDHDRIPALLAQVGETVNRYFARLDELPVRSPESEAAAGRFIGALPEEGEGSAAALTRLLAEGVEAATRSAGPRFFHFVTGGSTPAALAADWFASALDNNAGLWVSSPLGSRLEQLALEWLKDLFGLPRDWGGVLTTGATMANFTALAAARQWWGQQHGAS